jgi:hypothetical protein
MPDVHRLSASAASCSPWSRLQQQQQQRQGVMNYSMCIAYISLGSFMPTLPCSCLQQQQQAQCQQQCMRQRTTAVTPGASPRPPAASPRAANATAAAALPAPDARRLSPLPLLNGVRLCLVARVYPWCQQCMQQPPQQ